jgi:hypothetical protein
MNASAKLEAAAQSAIDTPEVQQVLQITKNSRVVSMHQLLANVCELQGCTFTQHGVPCDPLTVMSPSMLLPILAWDVQDRGQDLLGEDLGCALKLDNHSIFGARAIVPHMTGHIVDLFRALFFMHSATTIFGLRPNASIEIGPLIESLRDQFQVFIQALSSKEGEIPWPLQSRLN